MSSFVDVFKTLPGVIDPVLVFDSHAENAGPVAPVLLVQVTIDLLDAADAKRLFVRFY